MAWNSCDFFRTFLVVLSILVLFGKEVVSDCYRTTIYEYKGHQHTTSDGLTCLRWDSFDHEFSDSESYTAATTSEDKNYCRDPGRDDYLWCYVNIDGQYRICDIEKCVTTDVDQCGTLKIEQPSILGRNVTFTFTPETTSDADLKWQRSIRSNPWAALPNDQKFTQYHRDGTYYLILTNTVRNNDEVFYRVDYKNNSVNCLMKTPKLQLKDVGHSSKCGFVYLRTSKVKDGENVELEYYPTKYVMEYQERFNRTWTRSSQNLTTSITLMKGVYEEEQEPNDKYVLTILLFKNRMNGRYGVNCRGTAGYSNIVEVILPVAPSAPVFEGLKDIDDCKGCIVGEDGDRFWVICKTSGGTQPVIVTMSMGNISLSSGRYNDTAYIAHFALHNRHHMTTMQCRVMNDALESPLIATARVYVIKPPTIQPFTVPQTLKEGNIGNITCIVGCGRPVPSVTLTISDRETPSAVKSQNFNANTSLYTNVISLTTFKRSWNKEHVKCCRFNEWYTIKSVCSTPKQLNIIFPPTDIKLEFKVEQNPPYNMYAVCTIYNSNPACRTNISAPYGIIGPVRYYSKVDQDHGAWNAEHAVNLNVVKDDNGKTIKCAADCENFSIDLKDERPIVLPHPPIIEFNISGSDLTVFQEEQAHVKCSAKSIPTSNISWIELSDAGNVSTNQCWMQTDCVIAIEANLTKQRMFICQADYLQTSNQKTLAVNILEKDARQYKDMDNSTSGDKLLIWIILGCCLAVLFLVVIVTVCLIAKKRKRKNKAKLETNQLRLSAMPDGMRDREDKLIVDPRGNLNDGAHAFDDTEVTYSQPVKNKQASNADETYSTVNKTRKSNAEASCSKKNEEGQMLYADLDFDSNDAPLKGAAAKRRDSPTEYVAIDFVKTATGMADENKPPEADNIYANQ